jgi:hypothetical protein
VLLLKGSVAPPGSSRCRRPLLPRFAVFPAWGPSCNGSPFRCRSTIRRRGLCWTGSRRSLHQSGSRRRHARFVPGRSENPASAPVFSHRDPRRNSRRGPHSWHTEPGRRFHPRRPGASSRGIRLGADYGNRRGHDRTASMLAVRPHLSARWAYLQAVIVRPALTRPGHDPGDRRCFPAAAALYRSPDQVAEE